MDPASALTILDAVTRLCAAIHQLAQNAKVHQQTCQEIVAFLKCIEDILSELKRSNRLSHDQMIAGPLQLLKVSLEEAKSLIEKCSRSKTLWNVFRNVREEFKTIEGDIQKYITLLTLALSTRNSVTHKSRQDSLAHISTKPQSIATDDGGVISQSFSARCLSITWGHDPRFWRWIRDKPGAKSQDVAYLVETVWLEVHGRVRCRLEPGEYTLTWRLQLEHPHHWSIGDGWNRTPVKFGLSTSLGQNDACQAFLKGSSGKLWSSNAMRIRDAGHGWREFDVGKVVVTDRMLLDLSFSLMEIGSGKWKHGLYIDGVYLGRGIMA